MRHFLHRLIRAFLAGTVFLSVLVIALKTYTTEREEAPEENFTALNDHSFIIEDDSNQLVISDNEYRLDKYQDILIADEINETQSAIEKPASSSFVEYKVQKSDTLMLIAFYHYSDYRRWKDIYRWNKDIVSSDYSLKKGSILKLYEPLKEYTPPIGHPYLIKKGDYLTKISKKVYGTSKKWKSIWRNNPTQIRDSDLIFAGFTLFYPDQIELTYGQLY